MREANKISILEVVRTAEGGMKNHYLSLLKGLGDRGLIVHGICNLEEVYNYSMKCKRIKYSKMDIAGTINPIKDILAIINLTKYIIDNNIDIVHAHGFKAGIVGRVSAIITKRRCIYTIHNFLPDKYQKGLALFFMKNIERLLRKYTHAYITVSKALSFHVTELTGEPLDRIHVVYNGIEFKKKFNAEPNKPGSSSRRRDFIIGTVARLIPSKGIKYLIEAVDILRNYDMDFKAIICGDGPCYKYLMDMVSDLNLHDYILFTGHVKDIMNYYKNFDVFVLPTLKEGLGISIIEAMSMGKPVIATKVGGIPEIITDGSNGYLIEPKNSKLIAEKIIYLYNNESIRRQVGFEAIYSIENKFNIHTMICRTKEIIFDILGDKNLEASTVRDYNKLELKNKEKKNNNV